SRLAAAFDELVPIAPLASRAVAICRMLDHPAYDCFYLALSELRNATLVTADRRLVQRVKGTEWEVQTWIL
ncbi:MAG TPA: type II toxin-antitoxin system VapC family toxin, partial [Acetobacteraceae bacterium]|nr:type II toxin-antitoxin system VapC family toxin [Acetobacteraceae bacterium]